MSIKVVMPRAGLTMVEGTITDWKVAEGSHVNKGDVIMTYENEKNSIDYEALDSGILHILAKEQETIKVGGTIGELAESQKEYAAMMDGSSSAEAAGKQATVPVPDQGSDGVTEGIVEIPMPRAGLTMVEGTITEWKVTEGTLVNKGDIVMEYENEKNSIAYEIVHGGYLHIVAATGDTVKVGKPIAFAAATKEEYDYLLSGAAPASDPGIKTVADVLANVTAEPEVQHDGHVRATGLAKKMAKEAGINIADVPASGGPDGARVVAKDVMAYQENQKRKPAAIPIPEMSREQDVITETPWVGIRKVIARNMFDSLQQSAQCTSVCEMDLTELLEMRKKFVEQQEFLGCKITVNDLLCMSIVKMLQKHSKVNATFDGKTLYSHKYVNLSVAVATESGLMVPVVRHADDLSLIELSKTMKDLGVRARDKKLKDGEQSGGTFTVSNVGMFPTDFATPIINPPEVGIMGFGRTTKKAVYLDGQFVPRDMMYAFFTFDHRVIDGLEVGRVFQDLQTLIEHPSLILT